MNWPCNKSAYQGKQLWICSGGARYRCVGGVPQKEACAKGCKMNPLGSDDQCQSTTQPGAWSCSKSSYQGNQLWTCKPGTSQMFRCNGQTVVQVTCPKGCKANSLGTNDACY